MLKRFLPLCALALALVLGACSNPIVSPAQPGLSQALDAAGAGSPRALGTRTDFREESIYFVMTTRFFDGDASNNARSSGDDAAGNPTSDPSWRGDFKGLIQKLDYIKALGFSTVWITPVVTNKSGYDFHGYHGYDFNTVDPRLESPGASFQNLIDACHAKGMKLVLDVVLNHASSYGAKGLAESSVADFNARTQGLFATSSFHDDWLKNWEDYTCQIGSIAGDCLDFNTEDAATRNYLINAYNKFIDMGVDSFRIDTVKHVSRAMFNRYFIPAFKARGGNNFFLFGEVCTRVHEVWNKGVAPLSTPFYTWAERANYSADDTAAALEAYNYEANQGPSNQPVSSNHYLSGNAYHAPDTSKASGMAVIDFPVHWNFGNASSAFGMRGGDIYYNDATQNVVYVDSHDYGPDMDTRYHGGTNAWAENFDLMFTWRGIPTVYYGSEIEFQAGMPCDKGTTAPLSTTGRAYFGDRIEGSVSVSDFGVYSNATGAMASTLAMPLAKHLTRLNLIRRAIPALQKGQYSTDGVSGNMAFKRRYTAAGIDSFALVTISGDAVFSGIPNGTYVDAVTGDSRTISNGVLSTSGTAAQGAMKVYVLNGPGKIGSDTQWLTGGGSVVVPAAPANPGVGNPTRNSLSLSWSASTGASSYTVYRGAQAGGSFAPIATQGGTSYVDTGLNPATTYYYYVTANNSAGSSGSSATVNGTTLPASAFSSVYPSMYLRGTFNGWASSPMSLVADNTWQLAVNLSGGTSHAFKFDAYANWSTNWGDTNGDGVLEPSGANINLSAASSGSYLFTLNDASLAYSVSAPGLVCATPVFSLPAGPVAAGTVLNISSATAGSTIHYTIDGSTPSAASPSGGAGSASASVPINAAMTVKAVAMKSGAGDSALASAAFTIATGSAGQFKIVMKSNASAQTVSFPGDANAWSLSASTLSLAANATGTVTLPGAVTSANLARGSNGSTLELKVVNGTSYASQWAFSAWTLGSGISLADSGRQINLACSDNDDVTLTIDVSSQSLALSVIAY